MTKLAASGLSLLLATSLAAGAVLAFADVEARAITYQLDIPAEDLTSALQAFAIASHHKLLYKTELTAGKSSVRLQGEYTAEKAMERLLTGTGLTFEITGSSVVLIRDTSCTGKTGDLVESPQSPPDAEETRSAPPSQPRNSTPLRLAQAGPGAASSD